MVLTRSYYRNQKAQLIKQLEDICVGGKSQNRDWNRTCDMFWAIQWQKLGYTFIKNNIFC